MRLEARTSSRFHSRREHDERERIPQRPSATVPRVLFSRGTSKIRIRDKTPNFP